MRIIVAPDSFKGSMTSDQICHIMKEEIQQMFPDSEVICFPIADGGEGTVDAVMNITGGTYVDTMVKDPLFQDIHAKYGMTEDGAAVIEMAQASGLSLVPMNLRNPLNTTSYGTGQLILHALEGGAKNVVIGLGGSATNDGGLGLLSALGAKFYDADHAEIIPVGSNMIRVHSFDDSALGKIEKDVSIKVMCDITNPLLGERGATHVFGPQKGADPNIEGTLEDGMRHFSKTVSDYYGKDETDYPGAGAAGGLGWALKTFLNADLCSGIETLMEIGHMSRLIESADLIFSGEGHADSQSVDGKVLSGLGALCQSKGKPLIAVVGGMSLDAEKLFDIGVTSIVTTVCDVSSLSDCMEHSEEYLRSAMRRCLRVLKINISEKWEK